MDSEAPTKSRGISLVNIANRLQVLDANQHEIKMVGSPVKVHQLFKVGKGTREFVFLRFQYPNGHLEFYLNEVTMGGQLQMVENDEEFEEINCFIELAMNRIKPEGSSL